MSSTITGIINALNQEFSTSINKIYINSLKRHVEFRDISVIEQKTISKTIVANEDNQSLIYDAQVALLQKICLDPTVDILKLTEFDRIKIMMQLYHLNFFASEPEIECPNCKTSAKYVINFNSTVENLNSIELTDVIVEDQIDNRKYTITLNFPTVEKISNYRKYIFEQDRQNAEKTELSQMDMLELYIKALSIKNLDSGATIDIDFNQLAYTEYIDVLNILPQALLFKSDSKLVIAVQNLFKLIQDSIQDIQCISCKTPLGINSSITSFFTF